MANDAYPYWIVTARRRSYDQEGPGFAESHNWSSTRVQAENEILAHAMVLRTLPSYAHIVSIAREVWSDGEAPPAEPL